MTMQTVDAESFAKYHEERARHGGASQEFHERAASFLRSLAAAAKERDELRERIGNSLVALSAPELWSVRVSNAREALAPCQTFVGAGSRRTPAPKPSEPSTGET